MRDIIFFKEKADTTICLFSVLYVTSLLANLAFGYRYINIGSFIQSGGIFIFPISFIISDILTEIYGSNLAKKLVLYGVACQFIFALYAFFIVHIPAPSFLFNKNIYYEVFSPYLKFAIASTSSIVIGAWVNIVLLSKFSEYIGGKYFALRALMASTVGELLVTVISMFIANMNRVSLDMLLYMICCCFFMKTIISFFAIWPAAIIVSKIENPDDSDISIYNIKRPIKYIKNLFLVAWNAQGYVYNLEFINIFTRKVSLYYKGSRGVIMLPLDKVISNESIITKIKPMDAAHIGYYFGLTSDRSEGNSSYLINKKDLGINQILKKGGYNITSINRMGKLRIEDSKSKLMIEKMPTELYGNRSHMIKFSPSQALYIGYLASLEEKSRVKDSISNHPYLRLVQ